MKWSQVALLSVGGMLGVNARYGLGLWVSRWASPQFPWATWLINVTGSFAIGFLSVVLARWVPHPNARLLLVVGFLGGYTTYSSFALESLTLWERGERGLGVAYVVSTVFAGLMAVALGAALGRAVTVPRVLRTEPIAAARGGTSARPLADEVGEGPAP